MDTRQINEVFKSIGEELISTEPVLGHLKDAGIVYLESAHAKKHGNKLVLGQCEKIQNKNQWAIPYDFSVTIFMPNIEGMTTDQIKILMFHELLHISEDNTKVVPHDLEDFKLIIDRFGTEWAKVGEAYNGSEG